MPPIERLAGTGVRGSACRTSVPAPPELSQDLRTVLFYLALQNQSPRLWARAQFQVYPC